MTRAIPVILLSLLFLSGCNLLAPDDPGISGETRSDIIDLTGEWRVVLHYEVLDVVHVENQLTIIAMDCLPTKCLLAGYIERERLGTPQRHRFSLAEYYPEAEFVKIHYQYLTIQGFTRTAYLFFDQFNLTSVPERSMAGHFIVYAQEAPALFYDSDDKAILDATHKGKGIHAGQLTANLEALKY